MNSSLYHFRSNNQLILKRVATTVALLLLVFVLAACGGGEDPTPVPSPTPLPAAVANTPVPEPTEADADAETAAEAESEAEQPESPLMADSPLPTPTPMPVAYAADTEAGLAEVRGRAVNPVTGEPVASTYVRLAELYCAPDVQPDEKQERCIWGLDDAQSPFAETDADGNFVFTNVIPGEFVFFVGDYTVLNGYAIALDDQNVATIFTPVADEGLDLGTVPVIYPAVPE